MAKVKEITHEEELEENKTKTTETGTTTAVTVAAPKLPTAANNGGIAPPRDPFADYADEVAPQHLIGELMKFAKGDFSTGKSGEEKVVPVGTQFAVGMDLAMVGFIKWVNGKPGGHALVRIADGGPRPRRQDIGDHDEDLWDVDSEGNPRDPWQPVMYLPLLAANGALFTLSVSGVAGIREAGALCRAYAGRRKTRPLDLPKIALGVDSYMHRDRSKGRIKYPTFNIVGWAHQLDFMKALAAAGLMLDDDVPTVPEEPVGPALPGATVLTHPRSGQQRDEIDEPPPHDQVPDRGDPDDDIPF